MNTPSFLTNSVKISTQTFNQPTHSTQTFNQDSSPLHLGISFDSVPSILPLNLADAQLTKEEESRNI